MAAAKNPLFDRLTRMLPKVPLGGPLPRKEIIKALRALQKYAEHLIEVLQKHDAAAPGKKKAARKPARRKAVKAA